MRRPVIQALLPAIGICFVLTSPLSATEFTDPDWPCVQRKVSELSLGQMWSGPPPEGDWSDTPQVSDLAAAIAPRRTPLESVEVMLDQFVANLPEADRETRLAQLAQGVIDTIDAERGQLIEGIARYAHNQTLLSTRVEELQAELVALDRSDPTEIDRVEEIEDTLDWETRIFRDRAQSLTYVCETPVLLEQRAFAIARLIAARL